LLQKSTYSRDTIWKRTDLILKAQNGDDFVTVKAWDLNSELLDTIQHGQLITLYSVTITKYNEIKDITITNETSVEVTEILYTVSQLIINSCCIHTMLVQYVTKLGYFVANTVNL